MCVNVIRKQIFISVYFGTIFHNKHGIVGQLNIYTLEWEITKREARD